MQKKIKDLFDLIPTGPRMDPKTALVSSPSLIHCGRNA